MVKKTVRHLKVKWGIQRNRDLAAIFLAFSLAGMSVSVFRKPLFAALGITHATPLWIKIAIYLPLMVPIYQISLMLFGTLLGQFSFFWSKQKRLALRLRQLVVR